MNTKYSLREANELSFNPRRLRKTRDTGSSKYGVSHASVSYTPYYT